jgi:ectoine hydroxylase-related dioxygenase (phytanoyl-CoA dioxygenase family)
LAVRAGNARLSLRFDLQSIEVNQTRTRTSLTQDQLSQYRDDGFLVVTNSLLPEGEVKAVRERVDRLYDRWPTLPRRLAPGTSREVQPSIARIHRLTALDPALAHCQLLQTCRELAAGILGTRQVWCRFDGSVYKHPGAKNVKWHQDFATSTMGTPKRSVHFWIPLNDHAGNAGTMMFEPGSHHKVAPRHCVGTRLSRQPAHSAEVAAATTVGVPLSIGNFSIHTPMTTHGSNPNLSGQIRKALVLEFSPGAWSAVRQIGPSLFSRFLSRG